MKIDRLLAILTILLQKEKITAPELARRLEVTRRTIGRDIEDLCKAGFPIVTQQGAGGGIYIAEGYKLDRNVFTKDELQNIIIGLKGLESVDGASNIEMLLNKLTPEHDAMISLKDSVIIDLSSYYKDSLSEKIDLLKTAIREQQLVSFDYYSDKGMSNRTIEPYFIIFKWSHWYVFGYCDKVKDFRLFKLNRLWKLQLQNQNFDKRTIPEEKKDLDAHITDHNEMEIIFDRSVKYLLVEEYGPDCFRTMEDGNLYFKRGYTNIEHMVRWILSFGDKAEVVFPPQLKNAIKEQVLRLSLLYKK